MQPVTADALVVVVISIMETLIAVALYMTEVEPAFLGQVVEDAGYLAKGSHNGTLCIGVPRSLQVLELAVRTQLHFLLAE